MVIVSTAGEGILMFSLRHSGKKDSMHVLSVINLHRLWIAGRGGKFRFRREKSRLDPEDFFSANQLSTL